MKPTVGRIVHYQSYGTPKGEYKSKPIAAVITQVNEDGSTCGLCIFNPTGLFFNTDIKFSAEPAPGHWNWPPRTEEAKQAEFDAAMTTHAPKP